MRSTGEVMGVGRTFAEAMLKSQLGAGSRLPTKGNVVLTVKNADKARTVKVASDLINLGFNLMATKGTAAAIAEAGIPVRLVNKVKDGRPHIADLIKAGEVQLIFTTVDETRTAIADSRYIRTAAIANRVTDDITVVSLQELHAELP
jgi:carbamoyl-phosphate synthase large subunit